METRNVKNVKKKWNRRKRERDMDVIKKIIIQESGAGPGETVNLKLIDDFSIDGDTYTVKPAMWSLKVQQYLKGQYQQWWPIIFQFALQELGVVKPGDEVSESTYQMCLSIAKEKD